MFKIVFAWTLIYMSLALQAQTKLIEKITKSSPDEIVIPYEKYQLSNGLILVIHEDHSDPIVHVDVTYHVGSAREEIGKSGFAHFFEHMMFQGSDHVGDEQHFKIITEAGGTLNGSTNRDRTNYYETVPSNQLEKMLWLESDRMGFLLDAVTQRKFEVQRATVKNERGQNYDNRPYGLVQESLAKNLFPYGHPYSWLTIGYIDDLNRVNVQDLKNFFLRWYGPNNAVLTIGGDIEPKEVIRLAEKYFGSIPVGPKVEPTKLLAPKLDADRYVSMVDQYAKLPMLYMAMPTPPSYAKEEAALECLADILGGGNNSILYQRLVKTQKALRANAYNSSSELAGTFQFSVMPKAGISLAEMEKELRACLKEFETRGVNDDDITKFKQRVEASLINGLESVSGKVSQLAAYQTYTGNPDFIKEELKRYMAVTKSDVEKVYNQFLKNKPVVVLSVLTKGTENLIAAPDNYTVNTSNYKAPNYGYTGLKYAKAKDAFDRSAMPASGLAPVVKVPPFKTMVEDGMKIMVSESTEIPTVVISIALPGGILADQPVINKTGRASMFASMMNEDTKSLTAEQMQALLDKLGSSITVSTGLEATNVVVRCLKKNLNATLDLLETRLLEPRFTPEAFDRLKNQNLENIKNSKIRAAVVASTAFDAIAYGKENIQGVSSSGTETTVKNLTLQDMEDYYKQFVSRDGLEAVVVGAVDESDARNILNRLKKLPFTPVSKPVLPPFNKTVPVKTIYVVNIPKAAQTEFRIGYVSGMTYDATGEYYKTTLMNYPLGGAFNSRVNLNLREDKGWTYGARTNFSATKFDGGFTFSSGIRSSATDSALVEVLREITQYYQSGIKAEEVNFMKSAILLSEARKYETGFQKAGFLRNILHYDLPANYTEQQNQILASITQAEINALAMKWLNPESMFIVLAGDKDAIGKGLEKLDYQVVEVDAEGNKK